MAAQKEKKSTTSAISFFVNINYIHWEFNYRAKSNLPWQKAASMMYDFSNTESKCDAWNTNMAGSV